MYLIYNIVLVSSVIEKVIWLCMFFKVIFHYRLLQGMDIVPVSYGEFLLLVCFMCSSLYWLVPASSLITPTFAVGAISLFVSSLITPTFTMSLFVCESVSALYVDSLVFFFRFDL